MAKKKTASRPSQRPNQEKIINDLKLNLGVGFLEEFLKKKLDAKVRLRDNFVAFVRTKGGGLFIAGGDVVAGFMRHKNFSMVFTGYSSGEVSEVKSLFHEIHDYVCSRYSNDDFQSTIVLDFISTYLRSVMENKEAPQGLAVEMIIVDVASNIIRIYTTGDHEKDNLKRIEDNYFVAGCYDDGLRKRLGKELAVLIDSTEKMTEEKAAEVIVHLKKKFKLPYIGFQVFSL